MDKKHPHAKPGQKLCEMSCNIVGLLAFTSAVLLLIKQSLTNTIYNKTPQNKREPILQGGESQLLKYDLILKKASL